PSTKAWKLIRQAMLESKAGHNPQCATLALEALAAWERDRRADWTGPERGSILRAVIIALRSANQVDKAFDLRQKLEKLTKYEDDFSPSAADRSAGTTKEVQILDGGNGPATQSVMQYVNLPRDDKFVDGNEVTSADRLGSKVKVKLVFADEGKQRYSVQVFGSLDNVEYTDE